MRDHQSHATLLVTTADESHFDLALEMMDSVRRFSELAPMKLGMLDAGLTPGQRELLLAKGVVVASAQWEFGGDPPPGMRRGLLAMLSRPFLPKYFPDFDVLVYLDSDTWVQMASGITDLVAAAYRADIAAVPELHPCYGHLYDRPKRQWRVGGLGAVAGRCTGPSPRRCHVVGWQTPVRRIASSGTPHRTKCAQLCLLQASLHPVPTTINLQFRLFVRLARFRSGQWQVGRAVLATHSDSNHSPYGRWEGSDPGRGL